METPRAEVVKQFREATGMGWLASKLFLAGRSTELCQKILRAASEQGCRPLHDPVEDDPALSAIIQDARKQAADQVQRWVDNNNEKLRANGQVHMISESPRGICHLQWKYMKEILREQNVLWYSPQEMNPGIIFD